MKTATRKHPHLKRYKTRGIWFWKVSFALMGHQVRKQGFASFQAAEEYYHSVRALIRSGEFGSLSTHEMSGWTMDEMWDLYFRTVGAARRKATRANGSSVWKNHIKGLIGSYKVVDVSRKVLTSFVGKLRDKGLSDNYIHTIKAEVMNVLKFAQDYEVIEFVPPFPNLSKKPKKKEICSPEEVFAIAAAAPTRQWRDMILVQYTLALRIGELLGLTPGKFNLEEGWVMIDAQKTRSKEERGRFNLGPTKTGISRKLPLSPSLVELLEPYVQNREPQAPLWISDWLTPVSRAGYTKMLAKAVQNSDVQKSISSHCLRASMLDYLVNQTNLSVQAVAYYARHSVKVLVSRYSQTDVEGLFSFFQRSEPVVLKQSCDLLAELDLEVL